MRLIALGLMVLLVLLPSLMILFAKHRAFSVRAPMAALAFVSPIVMIALVNMLPWLTNNSPTATQWAHLIGLGLWALGFFLPWVIFALFLHIGPPKSRGSLQ